MDTKTHDQLHHLYISELGIPKCSVCLECDAQLKHPLALWHVGREFRKAPVRPLFAGKPHRGIPGDLLPNGIVNGNKMANELFWGSWAYWSYTREIAIKVFGDSKSGWDKIAMTNVIKCTNTGADDGSSSVDQTSGKMAKSCIADLGVFASEGKIIQPTHIILYTGYAFDSWIERLFPKGSSSWKPVTDSGHKRKCGAKMLRWWEWLGKSPWEASIKFLVVGHPERMKKQVYTTMISDWLLGDSL